MPFGGAVKLQGESEYKKALQGITQNLKELAAQMKLTSATYAGNDKSMQALVTKGNELNSKLGLQKEKLAQLKQQYESMNQQYQTNTAKHSELLKKYDDEKSKLENIGKTIGTTSKEYQDQEKVVNSLAKQVEQSTKNQDANAKSMSDMGTKIKSAEADVIKTENSISKLNQQMEKSKKATAESNSEYGKLKTTISQQEGELNKLKEKYANIVLEQGKNSESAKGLADKIKNLSGELQQNKDKMSEADKSADELDKSLKNVGDGAEKANGGFTVLKGALANFVANAAQSAITALKDIVKNTVEVGSNFDASMSKVQAVSGASGEEMLKLRDKAKEMGATTKFTATESAEAFNYMAMAGWKTEDMLNGIDGVLNLAAASGSDLATTSDIVTDALTAMGYGAGDAGRLADVMAAASSNANTNVEMMGQTFQYAAPIVGALKYSMEDTATAIGLMANAGIKGEKAGTALRSILTRLSAPPAECSKAMKELGITITNTDGTMKPLNEVIGDLRNSFSSLGEEEQTHMAKALAGQEAMSGLLAIVNAAPSDYDKLTKAVENSSGAAEKMADTMMDNAKGGMTLLKSNVESLQIALYEKFEPALRVGINVLNKLTDAIKFVVDHSSEFTTALTVMGAAVAGYVGYTTAINIMKNGWQSLVIVQKAVALGQKAVAAGQATLNAVMSANPIGVVVAAVAGLVAAFVLLWNKSEAFRNFWIGLWEAIKNAVKPVIEAIGKWFGEVWETIKKIWEPVGQWFSDLWNTITEPLGELAQSIGNAFQEAWNLIKQVWDTVQPYFEAIWAAIEAAFNVAENILGGFFSAAWDAITLVWDGAKAFFETVWKNIESVFSVVKTTLEGFFKTAWEAIKTVWDAATGYFKTVWESIAGIFKVVKKVLSGNFSDAWKGIKEIVDKWGKYFEGVWNGITKVFSKAKNWFSETFTKAWTAVKNVFKDWGNFFGGLWDTIKNKFSSIGTNIAEAIGGAVKSGINGVITIVENALNSAIGLINGAIGLINKIPGINIGQISELNFPRLAKGGVLDKGARMVIAGENGAEAIVPLEKNTKWIKMVAKEMQSYFMGNSKKNKSKVQTQINGVASGKDFIDGINAGIANKQKQHGVFATITDFAKRLLAKLRSALSEHSPSKATNEMGQFLIKGLSNGIEKTKDDPRKKVEEATKSIMDSIKGELSPEDALKTIKTLVEGMQTGFEEKENDLTKQVRGFSKSVRLALKFGFPVKDLIEQGKQQMEALAKGIEAEKNNPIKRAKEATKSIMDSIKDELSPEDALKTVEALVEGMQTGFGKKENRLTKQVRDFSKKVMEAYEKGLPVKDLIKKGKQQMEALAKGIEAEKNNPIKRAKEATKSIMDSIKDELSPEDALKTVEALVEGMQTGFGKKENRLTKQVRDFSKKVMEAYEKGLPVEDLIKKGQMLMAGLEKGINSEKNNVLTQVDDFGKKVVDELKNSLEKLQESKETLISINMNEISNYEQLYWELVSIIDANGKVIEGYENRASFITSTLSKAFGIEIKNIDGVIQSYNDLRNSLEKVIEKKKAQIILDSQEPMYKEAITKQAEALKNFRKIEETLTEQQKQMTNAKNEYAKATAEVTKAESSDNKSMLKRYKKQLELSKIRVQQLNNELNQIQQNYTNQENLLKEYAYNIGQYEKNMALMHAEKYEEMTNVSWEHVKNFKTAGDAQKAELKDLIENTKTQLNLLTVLRYKTGSDIYDHQIQTADRLLYNLGQTLKKYDSSLLDELDRVNIVWNDILDDQLSEITDHNIKFETDGLGNVKAYIDGIASGKSVSKATMAKLIKDSIFTATKETTHAKLTGELIIDGINAGVANEQKQRGLFATITDFAKRLLAKLRSALSEHSPSKATNEMGQFLIKGLSNGIKSEEDQTLKQIDKFGKKIVSTLKDSLNENVNLDIASNIDSNLQDATKIASRAATIPTQDFAIRKSAIANSTAPYNTPLFDYNRLVGAFKTALSEVSVELDGEEAGKFVERTVSRAILRT